MKVDVVNFAASSGLGHYAVSLARALAAHADVRLLTSTTIEPEVAALFPAIETPFRRTRTLPLDIGRYVRAVLARRPDVVVVQAFIKAPFLEIALVRAFRAAGIRCVATVHDVLPHEPKPWSRFALTRYWRAFDALVAHSEAARRELVAMGVRCPITVAPHGVYDIFDTQGLSREAARARLPELRADDFAVLFFGHVEPRKGIFPFVAAAALLKGRGLRFVVAGKPSLSPADLTRLEREGREAGVVLHLARIPFEAVQTYFAACDLVAMPYLEGTTSGVLKLALAFGKPVVATPIGDVPETVGTDTGVLVRVEALPHSLADGILSARARIAALTAGVGARQAADGWDRVAERYLEALRTSDAAPALDQQLPLSSGRG